ncbi:SpoIID/LytB domain-containing protein [Pseudactinotalea suaedae]|uniref:SpoIID/LytB domain-containing protein n=1 Tax=Pseudactinotalea suaedae TaxID=1524924 RepID=UPI00139161ED|nr:SpoIID/LytB domain-containing protein [Pseudactinotalea suaedae]
MIASVRPPGRRALAATIAVLMVAGALIVAQPPPAAAAAQISLTGRGYGHGIGMSQYGALGRAQAGHGYAQILAAYYPGTSLATGNDSQAVRVLVTSDTDGQASVRAETAMTVTTARGTAALPGSLSGGAPTQWRLRTVAGTLVLEGLVGTTWRAHGTPAISNLLSGAASADLAAADGTIQLQLGSRFREYRGAVRAVLGTSQRTVVVTTYASYLPSVVASEMPTSWHAQALAAQAVAARSYALFDQRSKSAGATYDTCDSVQCQVFNGEADYSAAGALVRTWPTASTRTAVAATAGRYVRDSAGPAFTQFSASNGGHSVAGSRPYLVAATDPYDTYPTWTVELTSSRLESAYPAIGSFRTLSVARDGRGSYGGRAQTVVVSGTGGSVSVSGAAFRSAFGLRSTLFAVTINQLPSLPRDLDANGTADLLATTASGHLYRWMGRGDATFLPRTLIGPGWQQMGARTITTGLGGRSSTELVAVDARSGRLLRYPSNGTGRFASPSVIGSAGWQTMDALLSGLGWDGPGTNGVIARHASTGALYYYVLGSNGTLRSAGRIGVGWNTMSHVLFAGDWNGDGGPDVMAVDQGGRLWLYPGSGAGSFLPRQQLGHGWSGMSSLVGGSDWNGDGVLDLLATDGTGRLWLYAGNGTGAFRPRQQIGVGWSSFSLIT